MLFGGSLTIVVAEVTETVVETIGTSGFGLSRINNLCLDALLDDAVVRFFGRACTPNKSDIGSLDLAIGRFFKLFRTNDTKRSNRMSVKISL